MWFTIIYTGNLPNIVYQLYFNKKYTYKNAKKIETLCNTSHCVWKATVPSDDLSSGWRQAKSITADWDGICGI